MSATSFALKRLTQTNIDENLEDFDDDLEEDLEEDNDVADEDDDETPLADSLRFRSRIAFFHVISFFGKHAMKRPMKKETNAANRKPIHHRPTQLGCAGVRPSTES